MHKEFAGGRQSESLARPHLPVNGIPMVDLVSAANAMGPMPTDSIRTPMIRTSRRFMDPPICHFWIYRSLLVNAREQNIRLLTPEVSEALHKDIAMQQGLRSGTAQALPVQSSQHH